VGLCFENIYLIVWGPSRQILS